MQKKNMGNCHLCLTDDNFSLEEIFRYKRLTFWFPRLFLSFYLFYFFSYASVVFCLLSSILCFSYVFSCLWSTPNKGLGDGEDVHVWRRRFSDAYGHALLFFNTAWTPRRNRWTKDQAWSGLSEGMASVYIGVYGDGKWLGSRPGWWCVDLRCSNWYCVCFSIVLSACFFPYCIPYLKIGRFEAAVGWSGNGCCYGAGYISRHMLDWLGSSLLVVSLHL